MTCRFLLFIAPLLAVVAAASARAAEATLCNDSFQDGGNAGFQEGFISGEMAAVKLSAPVDGYPYTILAVHLLFGDRQGEFAGDGFNVQFKIFDDDATSSVNGFANFPGTELFSADAGLLSSAEGVNEAVFETPFTVDETTGDVWLAIAFLHNGPPSVARDDTATGSAARNAIFSTTTFGGWESTGTAGVQGDWIMRAVVDTPSTSTNDACLFEDPGIAEGEGEPGEGEGEGNEGEGEPIDPGALLITSINPSTAGRGEPITVTITGGGFDATTTFRVGPETCGAPQVQNPGAALCTLAGTLPAGVYDVNAQKGADTFTFPSGFIVTEGGCGCRTSTTAPAWIALVALYLAGRLRGRRAGAVAAHATAAHAMAALTRAT